MRFRTCGVSGALELFELAKRFVDIYVFLSFRRQALVAEQAGLTWLGNSHHFPPYFNYGTVGTASSTLRLGRCSETTAMQQNEWQYGCSPEAKELSLDPKILA